jgi:hypothetical protein
MCKHLQICVLVSTYQKHGLKLLALITSLISTSYPYIDIILLDTDVKLHSVQWMQDNARVLNKRSNDANKRDIVHVSTYSQRYVQERYPTITVPDYG